MVSEPSEPSKHINATTFGPGNQAGVTHGLGPLKRAVNTLGNKGIRQANVYR
jgi:hypothetical protein